MSRRRKGWTDSEQDRFQHSLLIGILVGPALSGVPIIAFGLSGRSAVVVAAFVVLLVASMTWGFQTHRALEKEREEACHRDQGVGDGPSLGEIGRWFTGFVDVENAHYVVAVDPWDEDRGDYRTPESADRLAAAASDRISQRFGANLSVTWRWRDSWREPAWDPDQYDRQCAEAARARRLSQRVGSGPTLGELHQWFTGFVGVESGTYVLATGYRDPFAAEEMAVAMSREASEYFHAPVPVTWRSGGEALIAF